MSQKRIIRNQISSVYIGTNGRGIFYGDIAGSAPLPTTTAGSTTSTVISGTTTTPTSTRSPAATTTTSSDGQAPAGAYGQCGGQGWTGPTTCIAGYTCVVQNPCTSFVYVVFQKYRRTDLLKSTLNVSPAERRSTRFIQSHAKPITDAHIIKINSLSIPKNIHFIQARKAHNGVTIIINGRTVTFQTGRAMVARLSREFPTRRMRPVGTVTRSNSTMLKGGGKR